MFFLFKLVQGEWNKKNSGLPQSSSGGLAGRTPAHRSKDPGRPVCSDESLREYVDLYVRTSDPTLDLHNYTPHFEKKNHPELSYCFQNLLKTYKKVTWVISDI